MAQWLGDGVQGLQSNPRARAAVDCGEMRGGDCGGKCCGGKPGSLESKVILLSHVEWLEPSPLPPSPHMPALAAEQ